MVRRRAAFTLVELLVVITIIGMLMSLLLPAVNQARESARRADCQVRTRQIALATRNYEALNGYFPGYIMPSGSNYLTSWAVMLTPNLERNDIWTSWTTGGGPSSPAAQQVYWDQMVCPSNPPASMTGSIASYVVNCGRLDNTSSPPDYAANGMCFNLYNPPTGAGSKSYVKNSVDYLTAGKGDSYTLFNSENMLPTSVSPNINWVLSTAPTAPATYEIQCGFIWQMTSTPNIAQQINGDRVDYTKTIPAASTVIMDYCRPMSNHPGGVNVGFCDGHVQFLQQSINYNTYQSLMSPNPTYGSGTSYASSWINGYILSNSDF